LYPSRIYFLLVGYIVATCVIPEKHEAMNSNAPMRSGNTIIIMYLISVSCVNTSKRQEIA